MVAGFTVENTAEKEMHSPGQGKGQGKKKDCSSGWYLKYLSAYLVRYVPPT